MRVPNREAKLFHAMGHPFRLQLVEVLRREEACVCHLSALFGKPQPYVSKQLAELRDAGLVLDRRDGFRTYYRLADPTVGTVIDSARLALLAVGQLCAEDIVRTGITTYPVATCECPRCQAMKASANGAASPSDPKCCAG